MSNIKNSKLVHYDIHQCVIQNALHAKYAKHHPYQENINILAYFCFKKFPEPQHFPV